MVFFHLRRTDPHRVTFRIMELAENTTKKKLKMYGLHTNMRACA